MQNEPTKKVLFFCTNNVKSSASVFIEQLIIGRNNKYRSQYVPKVYAQS